MQNETTDQRAADTGTDDPIVAEVRAARQQIFAEAGYDLDELVRRLRERQAQSGHPIVNRPAAPSDHAA